MFFRRFLLSTLACLFTASTVLAALPGVKSTGTYALTQSNTINTKYRDGNDGSVVTWATIANVSVYTNATSSLNVCTTYLTQPGSPNATISVASGYTLPTGFSLGGTNNCVLSWATPAADTATVRLAATRTIVYTSNEFSITSSAPPAGDVDPPTIPTGCTAANGVGTVTIECDASSDPYVTTPGVVASYDFLHSVDGVSNLIAPSPGLSIPFTLYNVGTISSPGAPSVLQSGSTHQITAAGTGFVDGTSDQMGFYAAQVTGAASIAGILSSATTSSTFRGVGLCIRASTAANAVSLCLREQPGSTTLQCRGRATTGANKTTYYSNTTTTFPVQGRVRYDGASNVVCETSPDGNVWTALATVQLPALGSNPYYGTAASSTSAGTNTVATVDQVNLNNAARISKVISTTHAGTVRVRAKDSAPNISSYGAAIAVAPQAVTPTLNKQKWYPGTYIWNGGIRIANCGASSGTPNANYSCKLQSELDFIQSTCGETAITGYVIRAYPQSWVNATGGFNEGFAAWDALIAKAAGCGKKIAMGLQPVSFVGNSPNNAYFPNTVLNNPIYGATIGSISYYMRVWQPATIDLMTSWMQAYGARYNGNPTVAFVEPFGESAILLDNGQDGFSNSAVVAQILRYYPAIKQYWPNTPLRFHGNYLARGQDFVSIYNMCRANGCIHGGPDVLPRESIQANQVYGGGCVGGSKATECQGAVDLRSSADGLTPSKTPFAAEVQSPELSTGGKEGGPYTPQRLWDASRLGYDPADAGGSAGSWGTPALATRPQIFIWYKNDAFGGAPQKWTTGILPFLRLNPSPGFGGCPTDWVAAFGGCL